MAWSGDDDRRDARPRDAGPSLETVGARLWPFALTVFFGIRFPVEPSGSVVLAPSRPPRAEGLDSIISELERYAEGPLVQVRNRAGDPTGVGPSRGGGFPGLPLGHYKMSPGTREALRRARGL